MLSKNSSNELIVATFLQRVNEIEKRERRKRFFTLIFSQIHNLTSHSELNGEATVNVYFINLSSWLSLSIAIENTFAASLSDLDDAFWDFSIQKLISCWIEWMPFKMRKREKEKKEIEHIYHSVRWVCANRWTYVCVCASDSKWYIMHSLTWLR